MKKVLLGLMIVVLPAITATVASAENLAGKLGVSGRIGFIVPADSDWEGSGPLSSSTGFIGGGGIIYGATRNVALEADITHASYDLYLEPSYRDGTADVTNISLGGQWRFATKRPLTPYVGGGVSILITDYTYADVDTTAGLYLKGGVDYFVTPRFALNAELKGVISPSADMRDHLSAQHGSFDPSSFSGLFGVRYFFN